MFARCRAAIAEAQRDVDRPVEGNLRRSPRKHKRRGSGLGSDYLWSREMNQRFD